MYCFVHVGRVGHDGYRVSSVRFLLLVLISVGGLAAELVPGDWYLVPDTWYLVPGTWYLVPSNGNWYMVPGTPATLTVAALCYIPPAGLEIVHS